MKRNIIILLISIGIAVISGCGNTEKSVEEKSVQEVTKNSTESELYIDAMKEILSEAETENTEIVQETEIMADTEETEVVYTDEEIYKDILDMYYYKIAGGWDKTEDVSYLWHWAYTSAKTLADAGYTFIDLDGNGVSELLVTPVPEAGMGMLYDLYTCVGDEVIHLVSSGERSMYYLCEDKTVYLESSSGANLSTQETYVVKPEEKALALKEILVYDSNADADNPWFFGDASCYNKENSYDTSKMKQLTEEEALEINKNREITSISLNVFSNYTPQEEMPLDIALKKALNEVAGEENVLNYFSEDFDADGTVEMFGITGTDSGWDIDNAKIYYVSSDCQVTCIANFAYLAGYGGGYIRSAEIRNSVIMDTGSAKFLTFGGMAGQETYLYGIKDGKVYQPEVSGQHSNFYKIENDMYFAQPHEGGEGYYEYTYMFDAENGEFVRLN
ncbi:MAG: hypothetical protein J6A92_07780 [Lachnospiraceae bacterium]|nr:hypothetical protein [Lachnospiraceae bacterium]